MLDGEVQNEQKLCADHNDVIFNQHSHSLWYRQVYLSIKDNDNKIKCLIVTIQTFYVNLSSFFVVNR